MANLQTSTPNTIQMYNLFKKNVNNQDGQKVFCKDYEHVTAMAHFNYED